MADDYSHLNAPTVPNGDYMDESGISYSTSPTTRKRPRVVIGGETATELAAVTTSVAGTEYGLVTRPLSLCPGSPVATFNKATLVASGSETTVVSYTVPSGKTFYGMGFTASGTVEGYYTLTIDGVIKLASRTSPAAPAVNQFLPMPFLVATAGQVVAVKITQSNGITATQHEGTIFGFVI